MLFIGTCLLRPDNGPLKKRRLTKLWTWKGANIALEYDTAEAEKLLNKNKTEAKRKIDEIKSELDFLSEQILISEMSKARIVSWADKNEK